MKYGLTLMVTIGVCCGAVHAQPVISREAMRGPSGRFATPVELRSAVRDMTPSDDPKDWRVDTSVQWRPVVGPIRQIVPSAALPPQCEVMASNNNCGITFHEGRLYLGWRTAETHFASENARQYIISSGDGGQTWEWEWTIDMDSDLREPNFLVFNGELTFSFFEAGTNPLAFEPKAYWKIQRRTMGHWTGYMPGGDPGEVPWDIKVRDGIAWRTSYRGEHYNNDGYGNIDVFFSKSTDGKNWRAVDSTIPVIYNGGVSEVAFEFEEDGDLWAVTRNEDGDESGFGSHVCYAPANDLSNWQFPPYSDPERYDSPKMFRHGDDMYLVARHDLGGPFDQGQTSLPIESQRLYNWATYWFRPKRTALYKINKQTRAVEWLLDFPSAGDTAFPSIRRTGDHTFVIANYSSPVEHSDWGWLQGQTSPEGTQISLIELAFEPVP